MRAHLITTCPVSIEPPMFQLDTRAVLAVGDEAHLDLRFQRWVILPVGGDIPREHQTRVRFPREYAAPLTRASIVTALVPAAPDARLDHCIHGIGLADLVGCQRPPRAHLFGEHPPCHRLRRLNVYDFPHTVRIDTTGRRLLGHHGFLSLAVCRSAVSLNARSASSQNPSSQLRNTSMPRVLTA